MSALTDASQAVKDDVDRLVADMGAKITQAVTDALAANNVDEAAATAILQATKAEIDSFDPAAPPAPPAPPAS